MSTSRAKPEVANDRNACQKTSVLIAMRIIDRWSVLCSYSVAHGFCGPVN